MSDNISGQSITPLIDISNTLIPVFTFILGLVGKILWDLWHESHTQKKQMQNEGLRNHFIDLETNVILNIIGSLTNTHNTRGYIYVSRPRRDDEEEEYAPDIRNPFSYWPMRELGSGKFLEFQSHFPSQAHKIIELRNSAYKHNENLDSFDNKLGRLTKEKASNTCEIYSVAPRIIRYILNEIVKAGSEEIEKINEIKQRLKFKVSSHTYTDIGTRWELYSSMGLYARTASEEEAISVNNHISELIGSPSLLEQMKKIVMKADQIVNDARDNASNLNFITERYSKYGNSLKRKKNCTTCKLIFE